MHMGPHQTVRNYSNRILLSRFFHQLSERVIIRRAIEEWTFSRSTVVHVKHKPCRRDALLSRHVWSHWHWQSCCQSVAQATQAKGVRPGLLERVSEGVRP